MKWIRYVIAAITLFLGIGSTATGEAVFQLTAGISLLPIGTTSFGFAGVVSRLDKLASSLTDFRGQR